MTISIPIITWSVLSSLHEGNERTDELMNVTIIKPILNTQHNVKRNQNNSHLARRDEYLASSSKIEANLTNFAREFPDNNRFQLLWVKF